MPGKLASLVRAKYPGAYDDMDDASLEAAVLKAHPQYADLADEETDEPAGPEEPEPEQASLAPSDSGGIGLAAARVGLPTAARGANAFVESTGFPKVTGAIARGGTTAAGVVHGVLTGNPAEVIAAPRAGWAAGRGGYWLGKGMQTAARPVASALNAAAPYAQTLTTLGGAQGFGDLAQMAEPNRQDIGFLGIGASTPRSAAEQEAHPALLNFLISKLTGR